MLFKGGFTLAIIKPDITIIPSIHSTIKAIIEKNGFDIYFSQIFHLEKNEAKQFYSQHEGKFFYDRLVNHLSSGRIDVMLLIKTNAVSEWRKLVGPTKSFIAIRDYPHTLRGRYALTDVRNAVHGSDSNDSAINEALFFFPNVSIKV